MADKQMNTLTILHNVAPTDLVPVYSSTEAGTEKLKKVKAFELMIPRYPSDGKLQVIALHGTAYCLKNYGGGTIKIRVTALDIIKSVHAANGLTLTYGISKDNITWSENADPTLAYIEYVCMDSGTQQQWLKVSDGSNTAKVQTYVLVQDTYSLCV